MSTLVNTDTQRTEIAGSPAAWIPASAAECAMSLRAARGRKPSCSTPRITHTILGLHLAILVNRCDASLYFQHIFAQWLVKLDRIQIFVTNCVSSYINLLFMSFAHLKNCLFLLDLQEFLSLDRVFLSQLYLLQISSTHLWLVFYLFKWCLFINRSLILLLSNLSISFFMVDAFCVLRKFPTSRSWRYSLMVFSTISIVLPFICRDTFHLEFISVNGVK